MQEKENRNVSDDLEESHKAVTPEKPKWDES